MSEHIKVAVRVRPFLPHESPFGCVKVSENQIMVGDGRCFAFDTVFDASATSDDVYVGLGQPLANSFLEGFNVSTIAYGQTGAGKTYTMSALTSDVVQEIFCRLREDAAAAADQKQHKDRGFSLRVSALEVYNESVMDLLQGKASSLKSVSGVSQVSPLSSSPAAHQSPNNSNGSCNGGGNGNHHNANGRQRRQSLASGVINGSGGGAGNGQASPSLALREDPKGGIYVAGLMEVTVTTEEALRTCIEFATGNRKTATTLMNATSSRSHCVVTLVLQRRGIISRCCFVDLAGSERFKKSLGIGQDPSASAALLRASGIPVNGNGSNNNSHSGNSGNVGADADGSAANSIVMDRMREGISINGGLLALGNVIVALCEKKGHVPYRSSKLTRLLQPMLGGNSRTAMVACVSPLETSIEETLNTLKYANRAKSIKTNPSLVAAMPSFSGPEEAERIIAALRKELEDVQQQLAQALSNHGDKGPRRLTRTASLGKEPAKRSFSVVDTTGRGNAASSPLRPRKRSSSRAARKAADTPPGSSAASPTASSAATNRLLKQVSALKLQLEQERGVTRRLEEDLFNAEYTTMIEVEKRRAAEQRALELESLVTPNDDASSSACASVNSPDDSPRTKLMVSVARLKRLEEERDSLQAEKVRREADQERLSAALAGDGGGAPAGAAATLNREAALAELSTDIADKSNQISELERQNEEAARQLQAYERELAEIGTEKAKLEAELAKAEGMLERSEMARQQKEEERARLQAEFNERARAAEQRAMEYRRRVKRAEQEVKMRALNIQRIDLLKREVEKLREETARQRAVRRAEQKKGEQQSATHTQAVTHLQRKLREAEGQVGRLQGTLKLKEDEIARVKARVTAASNAGANAHVDPSGAAAAVVVKRPARLAGGGLAKGAAPVYHCAVPSGGSSVGVSSSIEDAAVQLKIDEEVRRLEQLEKELKELQDCREVLLQTRSTDAPKYASAIKGFTKRLQRIQADVDAGSARTPPLTDADRARLEAERADIEVKLKKLATFQHMFTEAEQQLVEFNDRIDSINETRRYHMRRVRQLQHERVAPPGDSSVCTARSPRGSTHTRPPLSPAFSIGAGGNASTTGGPPPSVREITTARARGSTGWHRHYLGCGADFLEVAASDGTAGAGGKGAAGAAGAVGGGEKVSQRRYVKQLEEMVQLLRRESDELRAQISAASAEGKKK